MEMAQKGGAWDGGSEEWGVRASTLNGMGALLSDRVL